MQNVTFKGWIRIEEGLVCVGGHIGPRLSPANILRTYDPFESETGLFKMFAAIEHTEAGVLEFAQRYGRAFDDLTDWYEAIALMASKVDQWQKGKPVDMFTFVEKDGLLRHQAFIQCKPSNGSFEVYVVVDDLQTALELQFNLAVGSRLKFRDCAQCGKPFAIGPSINRKTRVYCSSACSSAAYRARKKTAATKGTKRVKKKKGAR